MALMNPDNKMSLEEEKESKVNQSGEKPTTKSVIDLKEYAPHLLEQQKALLRTDSSTGQANKDLEFVKIIQQLY